MSRPDPRRTARALGELVTALGNARYRLMIEEIGRTLSSGSGELAARYLGDERLEAEIRHASADFEEAMSEWRATRGDCRESPSESHRALQEASARARRRLDERRPGITREAETRGRLIDLVETRLKEVLDRGRIHDELDRFVLEPFSSCPDLPMTLRESSRQTVRAMLEACRVS